MANSANVLRTRWRAFTRNSLRVRTDLMIAQAAALEILYAQKVIAEYREYPAQKAGTKYVRTFTLRDSWKIDPDTNPPRMLPSGLVCRIINDAKDPKGRFYATYVQGPWQTADHMDRNWTQAVTDVGEPASQHMLALRRDFRRDLQRIVNNNIRYV